MKRKTYKTPTVTVCLNVYGEPIAIEGDPSIITSEQMTKSRDEDIEREEELTQQDAQSPQNIPLW